MKNDGEDKWELGEADTSKQTKSRRRITSSPRRPVSPSRRRPMSRSQRLAESVIPRPSKRLGQHFLVDKRIVDRIIKSLQPKPDETIVEIGPGRGALTTELIPRAGRVVAVEFDRNLQPVLLEKFGSARNFKLVSGDALNTDFAFEIKPAQQARLVANLPYNISTAILQRLLEQRNYIPEMILMLQKEVVDRIKAPPGSTDRGYLSVLVSAYCEIEKLFDVAPGAFNPAPKVWSSVIRLIVRPRLPVEVKDEDLLWQVVSSGFAQRRKTIFNNLRSAPGPLLEVIKRHGGASIVLCRAEVELARRAETLTLEEWARISRELQ